MDADIVSYREHVETHMRWHHLADYLVVLGTLRFTALTGTPPTPAEVRIAVAKDRADSLFAEDPEHGHDWIGDLITTHRGFREAPSSLPAPRSRGRDGLAAHRPATGGGRAGHLAEAR